MQEELQALKEEFEQRIKQLEDKYKEDKEWPKNGDRYWCINKRGKVETYIYRNDESDTQMFEFGNVFKNEEETEFEIERLKVLRELKRMGSPFDFAFLNWCIYLDVNGNVGHYCEMEGCFVYGDYYFRSEEEVKEAIKKIGEDRIKKYLFRVVG